MGGAPAARRLEVRAFDAGRMLLREHRSTISAASEQHVKGRFFALFSKTGNNNCVSARIQRDIIQIPIR